MMVGQPGSPEQGFELLDQLDYHHYLGKMLIMKRDLELHQGEGGDDAALLPALMSGFSFVGVESTGSFENALLRSVFMK